MDTQTTIPMQQTQPSTYNHPCGDLLENGTRRDYLDIIVPLYRASITGDCKAARVILDRHRHLVRYSITENKETPLHVAVASPSTKFVRYIVNMMEVADLELHNRDGNTAFCLAAIAGNVGMAKIMVEKNPALPNIRGRDNMMPLYLAAFHGKHDMVTYLYDQHGGMKEDAYWTNDNRDDVLLKCVEAGIFDVGLQILNDNKELPQDKNIWNVLHILAQNNMALHAGIIVPNMNMFLVRHTFVLSFIGLLEIRVIKESNATAFLRLLWKRTMEKPKDIIDDILKGPMTHIGTYPSHVLFVAARMGNAKFLMELIREYPDLIWMRSDDGESIFHIAVAYRYLIIYKLLHEIGSMKDLITTMTDQQGNNILHLVGMYPEKNPYVDSLAAPFKLQSELLCHKFVSLEINIGKLFIVG
ncbi:hypothetical protein M8C21_011151 [Ambrosia artemisiifolia]|uniref:Ankyrin repeat-containing protein n=1 Tax=Ambrosia artemisiifolia TaxID=4212 RepID=A0AAD5GUK9_AMBAR|nr:hypothetical protein M8C21_011151 [Ambrosia artemisiifolia]